jgi:hypothetical protein
MFVEPSTGVCYSAMRSPYLGIEALWNERNYWVNVQPLDVDSMHHLNLNLRDTTAWEYVLIEDKRFVTEDDEEEEGQDADAAATGDTPAATAAGAFYREPPSDKDMLDLPPSWTNKLIIPRDAYNQRYPGGAKCIQYARTQRVHLLWEIGIHVREGCWSCGRVCPNDVSFDVWLGRLEL